MRMILDHFYLKLMNNCFAVTVGNLHYNGFTLGYVKYCPVGWESTWRDRFQHYGRLVETYSPVNVRTHTPWSMFIPQYGSTIPIIPDSLVTDIYDPRVRLQEIISKPNDQLEKNVANFVETISLNLGVESSLGVTGSILVKIHNEEVSDMDFVVYGLRESIDLIDFIENNPSVFEALGEHRLKDWCSRVNRATGLSCKESLKFYRRWRRGLYRGREYSLIYNDGVFREPVCNDNWFSLGWVEGYLELEGGLDALNYPSKSRVTSFRYIGGVEPRSDPNYVLSFEALYLPLLYEGGRCYVKGLLQVNEYSEYRILLGVIEVQTYLKMVD